MVNNTLHTENPTGSFAMPVKLGISILILNNVISIANQKRLVIEEPVFKEFASWTCR